MALLVTAHKPAIQSATIPTAPHVISSLNSEDEDPIFDFDKEGVLRSKEAIAYNRQCRTILAPGVDIREDMPRSKQSIDDWAHFSMLYECAQPPLAASPLPSSHL